MWNYIARLRYKTSSALHDFLRASHNRLNLRISNVVHRWPRDALIWNWFWVQGQGRESDWSINQGHTAWMAVRAYSVIAL